MWAGHRGHRRSSLATAFDYRWLKTLAWPIYGLQLGLLVLTLAIGDGVGGSARWVVDRAADLPVQRARQDPDDHRPGELPGGAAGPARLAAVDPRRLPAGRSAAGSWSCSSRTSGPRSSSRRSSPGCSGCRAPASAGWPSLAVGGRRDGPDRVDVRPARLPEAAPDRRSSTPNPDIQGAGYQLHQAQIAVGSGGLSARA